MLDHIFPSSILQKVYIFFYSDLLSYLWEIQISRNAPLTCLSINKANLLGSCMHIFQVFN